MSLDDFTVSTLCGRPGESGYKEGAGSEALFNCIGDVVPLKSDLIVCNAWNYCVCCVLLDGGASSLVAGSPGHEGFANGKRAEARFKWPAAVEADSAGNLFVADQWNHEIRKIDPSGVVSTVAGGTRGHKDGDAKEAQFTAPQGLKFDCEGNLLECDFFNQCLRRVNLQAGTVTTVAGQPGRKGHKDGPAKEALFHSPGYIVVDPTTRGMYVSFDNHTIRKVSKEGVVSTVCGQP